MEATLVSQDVVKYVFPPMVCIKQDLSSKVVGGTKNKLVVTSKTAQVCSNFDLWGGRQEV